MTPHFAPALRVAALLALPILFGAWRLDYLPEGGFRSYQAAPDSRTDSKTARKLAEVPRTQTMPPHTPEFKRKTHGRIFADDKDGARENCKACHGTDLRGGALGSACSSCHLSLGYYEHFSPNPGMTHGTAYLRNRVSCAQCHGPQGDKQGMACTDCHSYPHPKAWGLAANHGTAYLEQKGTDGGGLPLCLDCHGENSEFKKRNPEKFVSCATCHLPIPHPDTSAWTEGEHAADVGVYEGKCLNCHTGSKRLMPNFANGCLTSGCHTGTLQIRFRDNRAAAPQFKTPKTPKTERSVASQPSAAAKGGRK